MNDKNAVENEIKTNHVPIFHGSWRDKIWCDTTNKPIAMAEARHASDPPVMLAKDTGMQAVIAVANAAQLPMFGLRYPDDLSWITLAPLNMIAMKTIKAPTKMTAAEYQQFRAQLAGIQR